MDVLLDDMVAREPLPVHPVADIPLHVAPTFLTGAIPQHTVVPVNITTDNLADDAVLNLLESFYIGALVVALCACHDRQSLGFGLLGGRHDGAVTLGVHGNGLLQEGVHALRGRVLEMHRTEDRRSRNDNHVHPGVNDTLVGVETEEASRIGYFDAALLGKFLPQVAESVGENISQGSDLDAVSGVQQVDDSAGSASAAADNADFQFASVYGLVTQFGDVVLSPERGQFRSLGYLLELNKLMYLELLNASLAQKDI